jgi:predicted nucleotidyltransferase
MHNNGNIGIWTVGITYGVEVNMDQVLKQVIGISVRYKAKKVILFGSRARGDNSPVSDYDIAVFAEDLSPLDKARFSAEVEDIETLKKIDLLFFDTQHSWADNIVRDGVILYEQAGDEIA